MVKRCHLQGKYQLTTKASLPMLCQSAVGLQWMDKVSNKDFWERTNQVQIEIEIIKRRWEWLGHTLRKPKSNTTREALTSERGGDHKTPGDVTLSSNGAELATT